MKYLPYIIVIILTVVLMFFIMKGCEDPTPLDDSRELELVGKIDKLVSQIVILQAKNDSLEAIKQKVKTQIVIREREIDANIAKDSSNAIVEYRNSLVANNWLPDNGNTLSFREVGVGSKLMAKVPKLGLQINLCGEQLTIKDEIITDKDFIIKGKDDLIEIKNNNVEYYKGLYEDSNVWYRQPWFLITVGAVLTGGAIISINAVAK